MSNIIPFPTIAGIDITTDAEGRFNLNALHKAGGGDANKAPAQWLRTQQAQDFVDEVEKQTVQICIVSAEGRNGGTFAHELAAVEYAGWISPAFRIKVNQTFIDYRTGKLSDLAIGSTYQPDLALQIAESAARMLRMSDTSKIRMLSTICDIKGVPSTFLPSYVDESLVRALTALLKEHGISSSAKTVNLALLEMGILETLERKGSKGDIKSFKSLTASGLKYGRNETSPRNPRETQPLYFVKTFPELLDLINAHLESQEAA